MPASVTVLQLEYFVAAVEHGSLSAAAQALHPAVRVRVVGRNSAEVADAVRDGRLEPTVEVELPAAAVALVARGVGDAVVSWPLVATTGYADRLSHVSLEPVGAGTSVQGVDLGVRAPGAMR